MFAATAANIYESVHEAQETMSSGFDKVYSPQPEKVKIYDTLYSRYLDLGN